MKPDFLAVSDPDDYRRFREVFARAGYDPDGLVKRFGPIRLPTRFGSDLMHFLHLTGEGAPLDTLIRLFLLGAPVDERAAREAFDPAPLEAWLRAGLVERRDGAIAGAVRLLPLRELLLACDHVTALAPGEQRDLVMGITASTVALADFTVRRPVARALDVGTGGGVQALFAARHSQRVWGVDRCARSLVFARFNAGLNGVANAEFLEGDAFEPVRGRKFGLIVSNPPFAISPSQRYLYRDSGLGLDRFCERLVRQAPESLEEDGLCQITCDWVHIAGQDWKERLAGWFEGSGCDAWVIRLQAHDAASYAHMWVRDTEHVSAEEAARVYEDWACYLERERVESISTGLIAMRRRAGGANWLRIEDGPENTIAAFGDFIVLGFALRDYLESATSEMLLDERLRVSPDVRVQQDCEWSEKGWHVLAAQMRLERGLEYAGRLDLRLAALLEALDGRNTLREALEKLAAGLGVSVEKIAPNCLALVRQLIERGFLLPPGFNPPA